LNEKQRQKIEQLNIELHKNGSHKEMEDILRDCLEEVKHERQMNHQKTLQSL